jgi:hypothetical protein
VALRAFLNAAAVRQAGGLGAACQYFAQISNEELKSRIAGVHYAQLAEQARVQGDVHLNLNSGVVTILSAP